jgi:hypothetical protein
VFSAQRKATLLPFDWLCSTAGAEKTTQNQRMPRKNGAALPEQQAGAIYDRMVANVRSGDLVARYGGD